MSFHVVIDCCYNDSSNHHQPICKGNINLVVISLRDMNEFDLRKV